ncbi:MAG: MarR family winged helix-turn-helix transcriptional regulator [Hyphomicrobiales bacterium]
MARPAAPSFAGQAHVTKQSMGALIEYLEAGDYVERMPDPADGRARIVGLTDRGWKVVNSARVCLEQLEREWSALLGGRAYAAFRQSLATINARLAD